MCVTSDALREGWRVSSRSAQYEVHFDGRVRNARTLRVLKPQDSKSGRYAKVWLGAGNGVMVHQVVCETWNGVKPAGMPHVVDHIDNQGWRNCATNLRWCTYAMNTRNWYAMQARLQAGGEALGHHELEQLGDDEISQLYDRLEGTF